MKPNSIMVEISQWFPTHWGVKVHGDGWSNSKKKPRYVPAIYCILCFPADVFLNHLSSPMGIMWHNTDIHEAGAHSLFVHYGMLKILLS